MTMEPPRRPLAGALLLPLAAAAVAVVLSCCCCHGASAAAASFGDNFEITGAEDHVKTSADGQTWYLYLDNKTGNTNA
jgi:xyloglucan:xyloglucosyl transferase